MAVIAFRAVDATGGGGSPSDAKYLTAQAESGLSAEVNLGALTTGLLKHTVSGGVSTPATAVAGTDYVVPSVASLTSLGTISTALSGILKAASGVLSAAVAGTDYLSAASPVATADFTIYHSYTDISNYEGFKIDPAAGSVTLSAITAGTGTDDVSLIFTPAGKGFVSVTQPGDSTDSFAASTYFKNTSYQAGEGWRLRFADNFSSTEYAQIYTYWDGVASPGGWFVFSTQPNAGGAVAARLTINDLGDIIIGNTTTHDRIIITPVAKGAGQFDGTITSADLTAARTWTLPDATGTVAMLGGSDTQILFNDGGTALGGDSGMTFNKTTNEVTFTGTNNSTLLTLTNGSITGSGTTPFVSITGTWNTSGVVTGILANFTNTASAVLSKLIDLQLGGQSYFTVKRFLTSGSLEASYAQVANTRTTTGGPAFGTGYDSGAGDGFWFGSIGVGANHDTYIFTTGNASSGSTLHIGPAPNSFPGAVDLARGGGLLMDLVTYTGGGTNYVNIYTQASTDYGSEKAPELRLYPGYRTGTDKAGVPLLLKGGLATGNAVAGAIEFYTSPAGASGTTAQTYALRGAWDVNGNFIVGNTTDYDRIIITPVAKGAGQFDGTLTSADLTAAQTWTLPNTTGTLLTSSFGELYENGGSTAITVTTAGNYYQWASTTAGLSSSDVTLSTTTDDVTVTRAGKYMVTCSISFSATANAVVIAKIYKEGVATTIIGERKISTGGDIGSMTICGILDCAANDSIDLRFTSNSDSDTVTPKHVNLTVRRVGV